MKKCLSKIVAALVLSMAISSTGMATNVQASDQNEKVIAEYNLEEGGEKTYSFVDENGNEVIVTICELENKERVSNGSYSITYTSPGAWEAGFTVDVSNNKFTSAYKAYYQAITGNILSAALVKDSTTQVTYNIVYKNIILSVKTGVKAKITNGSIVVSQI